MDGLKDQTHPLLSFFLVNTQLVNWCRAHVDRFEWVNENAGLAFNFDFRNILHLSFCTSMLFSLTLNLHLVRASIHAGDPTKLRDTGNVPSM